jgi:hypothetical protein
MLSPKETDARRKHVTHKYLIDILYHTYFEKKRDKRQFFLIKTQPPRLTYIKRVERLRYFYLVISLTFNHLVTDTENGFNILSTTTCVADFLSD